MKLLLLLLLLFLLVSDLNPLQEGDGVRENQSFCSNLLFRGRMSPRGLQILQTRSERCCLGVRRDCVFVCVQLRERTSPSDHEAYRCSLAKQEFLGRINKNQIPAPVVPLLCATRESVGRFKARRVMDEAAHIPMRMIKLLPYSAPAWFLHHHPGARGQAFLLEKSLSWAPAIIAKLRRKMLTERDCAAETVVLSRCFGERGVKRARSIKETSREERGRGQEGSERGATGFKVQFEAAFLQHVDKSHLEMRRSAGRIRQRNQHLSADDDDDGFYIKQKPLLVPREQPDSINKPRYKIRATLDDNKEDFSGKIITKQGELRRPEGKRATERSHKNIENGNRGRLAYILRAGVDNNDDKQMLSEVGEDVLILLFPQTEAQTGRKGADVTGTTVNFTINEQNDPPPAEENFIIYSGFKCLKENQALLEIYALERSERRRIKASEVITETKKQVRATTEKMERTHANKVRRGNMRINHTKQDAPSDESVSPTPPSLKMMEMETAKTETSTVNKGIKETTTGAGVFNQSAADGPPRTTPTSPGGEIPRFIRCKTTDDKEKRDEASHSGLRMRDHFSVKPHKGKQKKKKEKEEEEEEEEEEAATNRPESERRDDRRGEGKLLMSTEAAKTTQRRHSGAKLKISDTITPSCRGLIHRTEAGWRHCVHRYNRHQSEPDSPPGSFKDTGQPQWDPPFIRRLKDNEEDEDDHFYYFNGVLKRVQNNFYPHDKRRRLRRRRDDHRDNDVFTQTEERGTLLSYFTRLTSRNKDRRGG